MLGTGTLGSALVLTWEDLNIVGGRKVCILIRDRRLVGPEELLDLVVPVLWDDRGGMNASSLESAGGESCRCLYSRSQDRNVRAALSKLVGSFEELTRHGTSASHAD